MRNKGLILFFTILIALICVYCLSFNIITWSIEKNAREFAQEQIELPETVQFIAETSAGDQMMEKQLRDSLYSHKESQFLALMKDSVVFLGQTYKQCKYKELNLGLDLRGGMNVTLEVSVPEIVFSLAHNAEDELFIKTYEKAVQQYNATTGGNFVDIFIANFDAEKKTLGLTNAALRTYFGDRAGKKNGTDQEIKDFLNTESNEIVDRTFKILSTRIDRFGVAQPNIQRLQGGRILVELPGIKEPERVTDLLKSTAKLEFWEVYNDQINGLPIQEIFRQADVKLAEDMKAQKALEAAAGVITDTTVNAEETVLNSLDSLDMTDEDDEESFEDYSTLGPILSKSVGTDGAAIGFFKEADRKDIDALMPQLLRHFGNNNVVFYWGTPEKNFGNAIPLIPLKKNNDRVGPKLSSETIDGARVVRSSRQDINQNNQVVVTMAMEERATAEWRKITRAAVENTSKVTMIAVVLDNIVYSYPSIRSEIPNGSSEISGSFSIDEAKDLATVLNSGNLEASVNIIQSEVVGPTLGQESIKAGLLSFLLAFVLVLGYMILYYSRAGFVADLALFTNIFFMMGILASLGGVLTLPGIAGIVLTLGMAVDANVIIYERIREELRMGKGMRVALEEGYKNAYSAIIDGNVTTLITAIVLYILGTGPVQGFATTLIIGLVSSLFTAILISRMIFENQLKKGKTLAFGNKVTNNMFVNTNFDFLKTKKVFYSISITICVICVASFAVQGLNPGIDFTGGRNYVVRFDQEVRTDEIREAVANEFGGGVEVKTFGGNDQVRITTNYKININDPAVDKECEAKLYKAVKEFYVKSEITETDFTQQVDPRGIQSSQKVQPTVARELLIDATWAVLISLLLIFLYIAVRFKNWQFGLSGVITLAHDALITVGLFSLFYKIAPFSMEVDQSFIAALLTVIGYSINNVVIIFDRVRENLSLYPKRENHINFNSAVNSTLGRTVNTAISTIIVLIAIFFFGGEVIRGFIFAMLAGVIAGSYSGIFIATPLALDLLGLKKSKINRVKNELK